MTFIEIPAGVDGDGLRAEIDAAPWGSTVILPGHGVNMGNAPLNLGKSMTLLGSRGAGEGNMSSSGSRLNFDHNGITVEHEQTVIENVMVAGKSREYGTGTHGINVVGAAATQNDSVGEVVFRNVSSWGFANGLRVGEYAHHVRSYDSAFGANVHGVRLARDNYNDVHFYGCSITNSTENNIIVEKDGGCGNLNIYSSHLGFAPRAIYQPEDSTRGGLYGMTIIGTPIENVEIQHINVQQLGSFNIIGGYWSRRNVTTNPGAAISFASNSMGPCYINTRFQGQGGGPLYSYVVEAREQANRPVQVIGNIASFAENAKSPNLSLAGYTDWRNPAVSNREFVYNEMGYPMVVYVAGGQFNSSTLVGAPGNAIDTGQTTGTFFVPAGDGLRLDYSTAPTWRWAPAW